MFYLESNLYQPFIYDRTFLKCLTFGIAIDYNFITIISFFVQAYSDRSIILYSSLSVGKHTNASFLSSLINFVKCCEGS